MAFKTRAGSTVALDDPEAMFRDFRSRKIEGPLGHQSDILRSYVDEAIDSPDVAFQLPTGSGKTLVGLLVAEWRRRRDQLRVVYLCPTNQLVNQVAEQANTQYGMEALAFTGPKSGYDPNAKAKYQQAGAVAVTTYSALFNIRPFFNNPSVIVLDDTHAAENYIASHWSVEVKRQGSENNELFKVLAQCLRDRLTPVGFRRMTTDTDDPTDAAWVEKIPTPILLGLREEITSIFEKHLDGSQRYQWGVLKDSLSACHLYVSASKILLRPLLPPTATHAPFKNARQRLYMSATLGEGGELERLTGMSPIQRLPVPKGWDKQGIGRRFFVFPQCSVETDEAEELTLQAMKLTSRTLCLTTRGLHAKEMHEKIEKQLRYRVFRASELEQSKGEFVQTNNAVAVVANRYDGIDLVGDECRLLVVHGLPRAMNAQERFLITRIGASSLYTDRVLTRVVQAVGRCTRSPTDYAAVIILGEELNRFLLTRENQQMLHPELQGEIQFGIEQSKETTVENVLENMRFFFGQTKEWQEADQTIVTHRMQAHQNPIEGVQNLQASVSHELSYQYAMWGENYPEALEAARRVLTELTDQRFRGYRAYWNYAAGSAAWLAYESGVAGMDALAREYFTNAARANSSIRWLAQLGRLGLGDGASEEFDDKLMTVVERLEVRLSELGTTNNNRFESRIKSILDGVGSSDSKQFEEGQRLLGELLGYDAHNSEGDADPDPWWIANDDWCLVFEDHTPDNEDGTIGAQKVRQAASHPDWIRARLSLARNAKIVSVLVTPRTCIAQGALPHTKDTAYWRLGDFRRFADEAVAAVRELRRTFPGAGDLAWRAEAISQFQRKGLDPESLTDQLAKNPLSNIPVA